MHTLRSEHVASAVRLVAEVRSLVARPDDAAMHLVNGLCGLVNGSSAGLCLRGARPGTAGARAMMLTCGGAASPVKITQLTAIYAQPELVLPHTDRLLADRRPLATGATSKFPRVNLKGVQAELYEAFLQLGGRGDRLLSKSHLANDSSRVGWLCIEREQGDRLFDPADVLVVDLINQHISPWFWPALRRAAMLDQAFG